MFMYTACPILSTSKCLWATTCYWQLVSDWLQTSDWLWLTDFSMTGDSQLATGTTSTLHFRKTESMPLPSGTTPYGCFDTVDDGLLKPRNLQEMMHLEKSNLFNRYQHKNYTSNLSIIFGGWPSHHNLPYLALHLGWVCGLKRLCRHLNNPQGSMLMIHLASSASTPVGETSDATTRKIISGKPLTTCQSNLSSDYITWLPMANQRLSYKLAWGEAQCVSESHKQAVVMFPPLLQEGYISLFVMAHRNERK